ncbi:MAG: cob(I)yrinic acid a,c-diamide adenosyltransferase [Betaproteobacteria bacterium]|nr:cob(I)yrinic acid a,c-diamide adenosyltransferase [Betaproteobacteria bacterium]
MGNRLSKITTRTGDDGSTGLGDGSRIRKSAARVAVLGELDEVNCHLGLLRTETLPQAIGDALARVQNQLFDLGGEISIPGHRMIHAEHVQELDAAIEHWNRDLPSLKEFILPGGTRAAALAHVARAAARRAERAMVTMADTEDVSPLGLQYLNRLSDFLFILARQLNRAGGSTDVIWTREPATAV